MSMPVVYATVNGVLVEEDRGGTVTTYVRDTLGSVIQTRDAAGSQTSSTTYWPFGEVRTSSGANPSPWGFCGVWGYYKDAVNRLYVRLRTLRIDLSRWLTVDPFWPLARAYAYARMNPVSRIDPSGLIPQQAKDRGCSEAQDTPLNDAWKKICSTLGDPQGSDSKFDLGAAIECAKSKLPSGCSSYTPPDLSQLGSCLKFFCIQGYEESIDCNDPKKKCKSNTCAYNECIPKFAGIPSPIHICPGAFGPCKPGETPPIDPGCTFGGGKAGPPYGIPCKEVTGLPPALGMLLHEMLHSCSLCGDQKCTEQFTQALACCLAKQIMNP